MCVLRQEQDCTKATHGDAQVVPGDGPLREPVYGPTRTPDREQTGNVFLLIIVDRFSKLVRAVPLAGITATDVSSAFCRDWISVYGPPDTVLTNNGPQFASLFFQGVCNLMGIRNLKRASAHACLWRSPSWEIYCRHPNFGRTEQEHKHKGIENKSAKYGLTAFEDQIKLHLRRRAWNTSD